MRKHFTTVHGVPGRSCQACTFVDLGSQELLKVAWARRKPGSPTPSTISQQLDAPPRRAVDLDSDPVTQSAHGCRKFHPRLP